MSIRVDGRLAIVFVLAVAAFGCGRDDTSPPAESRPDETAVGSPAPAPPGLAGDQGAAAVPVGIRASIQEVDVEGRKITLREVAPTPEGSEGTEAGSPPPGGAGMGTFPVDEPAAHMLESLSVGDEVLVTCTATARAVVTPPRGLADCNHVAAIAPSEVSPASR